MARPTLGGHGLPTDGGLAIRATAYHLADLQARILASSNRSALSRRQLLHMGYNAGPRALGRYLSGSTTPSSSVREYSQDVGQHFAYADAFYCGAGYGGARYGGAYRERQPEATWLLAAGPSGVHEMPHRY